MSGRSVNLTTLFLGRLRPPKQLTSILCTYSNWQLPFLNQRKEEWKHVAGLGIEPGTSGSWVRCATDCTTQPCSCVAKAGVTKSNIWRYYGNQLLAGPKWDFITSTQISTYPCIVLVPVMIFTIACEPDSKGHFTRSVQDLPYFFSYKTGFFPSKTIQKF